MGKVLRLLNELCPEGAPMVSLGQIGTFTRGNGLQKKDFVECGVGCIHYGQIFTYYGTYTYSTKSFIRPELAARLKKAKTGDLIIATTSENDDDVCKAVAWLGDGEIAISGDSYVFSHNQNPKYIAYLFQTQSFQEQKKKYITGTKVKRVSGDAMAKLFFPIPPLPVQEMIVSAMDTITELRENLKQELNSRDEQYRFLLETLYSL